MKWSTPVLPYLAVIAGMFWFRNAWIGLLGFHLGIVVSVLLARSHMPVGVLFQGSNLRWSILSILVCGSSGLSLYFYWSSIGVVSDLPARLEAFGLNRSTWPAFISYFVLVNPLMEEYFWRGYLGSPTQGLYGSDFLYAGFHAFILIDHIKAASIFYSLIILIVAGWFWRQLARLDHGLLAPVLGHMAADLMILLVIYRMSLF
jgi:membrane protease YdiL (CAAX protease family)